MWRHRRVGHWLPVLSDPAGVREPLPSRRLLAADLETLWDLAERHAVLAAVVQNLQQIHATSGASRVFRHRGSNTQLESSLEAGLAVANRRVMQRAALSLALHRQADEVLGALAGRDLPVALLKGPCFAHRLYAQPGLRPFTDIDLLVTRGDWDRVGQIMRQLGYVSDDVPMKYANGYGELGWSHPQRSGVVEIHHNLVNSPTLRRGLSVELGDLQFDLPRAGSAERTKRLSASSLLLIAAVHGAASHGFDKLQHLCDACQAARGTAGELDIAWLRAAAHSTGSTLALATALDLGARVMNEPVCARLLEQLALMWPRWLVRALITRPVVVRGQGPGRKWDSWRRQAFRQLLKRRGASNDLAPRALRVDRSSMAITRGRRLVANLERASGATECGLK